MILFGILGYIFKKIEIGLAPFALAMVISPMFENALRQSLLLSQGSLLIFVTRPISAVLSCAAFLLLVLGFIPQLWASIRGKIKEGEGE